MLILHWEKCQRLNKSAPLLPLQLERNCFELEKCATLVSAGIIFIPIFFPPLTHLAEKKSHLCLVPPLTLLSGRQVHFYLDREPLRCSAAVLLEVQSRTNLSRFDRPARLHRGEKCSRGGHLIKANTYSQLPSSISNAAMCCIFRKSKVLSEITPRHP